MRTFGDKPKAFQLEEGGELYYVGSEVYRDNKPFFLRCLNVLVHKKYLQKTALWYRPIQATGKMRVAKLRVGILRVEVRAKRASIWVKRDE